MSETRLTAADVEAMFKALWEQPHRVCWPHVAHPRYRGWRVVLSLDSPAPGTHIEEILCATCGDLVLLTPPEVLP